MPLNKQKKKMNFRKSEIYFQFEMDPDLTLT